MDSVELVKTICREREIPISKLERDCGFSNGYIRKLKEGKFPADRLKKIADYLDVSMDYLLTGEKKHYIDQDAADLAQSLFDDPDLHALLDAAKDCKPEYIKSAVQLLKTLKETNIDG